MLNAKRRFSRGRRRAWLASRSSVPIPTGAGPGVGRARDAGAPGRLDRHAVRGRVLRRPPARARTDGRGRRVWPRTVHRACRGFRSRARLGSRGPERGPDLPRRAAIVGMNEVDDRTRVELGEGVAERPLPGRVEPLEVPVDPGDGEEIQREREEATVGVIDSIAADPSIGWIVHGGLARSNRRLRAIVREMAPATRRRTPRDLGARSARRRRDAEARSEARRRRRQPPMR